MPRCCRAVRNGPGWRARSTSLDPQVRVVLIVMHHPPVADAANGQTAWTTTPRPNEQALAAYLQTAAAHSAARFVVSAGHIHNYERLAQDGSRLPGVGRRRRDALRSRTARAADLYQGADFPNYHYVRFELQRGDRQRAK